MQKAGQFRLQFQMQLQRAVEEARAGTTRAVLLERPSPRLHHLRAGSQAEVIVGTEHDAALALHDDLRPLPRFQRVEVGIEPMRAQFVGIGICKALAEDIHVLPPLRGLLAMIIA